MLSTKQELRLGGALAVLATLALAMSCRGFFVKPTVTSLALTPPTPTIQTGVTNNTVQMSAVATFNDGSTGSTGVTWTLDTSASNAASITTSGLITANAVGSGQITATSLQNPAIAGSTSLTVAPGCITSIAISPTSPSIAITDTQTFTALADTCAGQQDVTDVATWVSSNTTIATMQANVATGVAAGSTNITAKVGLITSPVDKLTVTAQ